MIVQYNYEFPRRLKLAAIGCGGHAQRNVFPTHLYSPVELVSVCDLNRERAGAVGRLFGARSVYSDYREMLERERPEAVQVVTNYDEKGHPRYPAIAIDCMRAGANVWIEKPPAASSEEIRQMMAVSRETGKIVGVGFKKMFFPANVKAKELISTAEFGGVSTITVCYPQGLLPLAARGDDKAMAGFLDHIVHPWSVLKLLGGPAESIFVRRAADGGTITSIRFVSGAVGSLNMPVHSGSGSRLEHTEIFGPGGHVIVDNNIRVSYYRHGPQVEGGYGRAGSAYDKGMDTAGSCWEPEFSLGQPHNKGIFLLGYAPEFIYFCQCVLEGKQPQVGSLEDALELMHVYEAYRQADEQVVRVGKGV